MIRSLMIPIGYSITLFASPLADAMYQEDPGGLY